MRNCLKNSGDAVLVIHKDDYLAFIVFVVTRKHQQIFPNNCNSFP